MTAVAAWRLGAGFSGRSETGLREARPPSPSPSSPQLGTGQSGGRHGFHRAHDPAHLTHSASRSRPDPLHDGLAFHVGRASCPRLPCLRHKGLELPFTTEATVMRQHRRPSIGIQVAFCFPSNVFRLRTTYWDVGSQSPRSSPPVTPTAPFSIYYPGCDCVPSPCPGPKKAMKGTHVYREVLLHRGRAALPSCRPLGPAPGRGRLSPPTLSPGPVSLRPSAAEEDWGPGVGRGGSLESVGSLPPTQPSTHLGTQFHHPNVLFINKNWSVKSASSLELRDGGKTEFPDMEKASKKETISLLLTGGLGLGFTSLGTNRETADLPLLG